MVRSRALSGLASTTIRRSTRPGCHCADSLGRQLVPLPVQHPLEPAIRGPISFAYISRPTSVVGEGSQRLGVARQPLLHPRRLPSLSRSGELFGLGYGPQMLSSPMEVSNPAEDKVVRVVAPTLEADDSSPPAKVLPRRPNGLSSVCRSSRRLLPPLLRVSGRTDCMTGNTYEGSGHVSSRLFLAIHQRRAISTGVGMAINLRYVVGNLASPERSCFQRSSPFSRCNSARLKGAHVFLEPRRFKPIGF